jgi:hypothetical protein
MAAEKKKRSGTRFGRFRERIGETAGTTPLGYGRGRGFGPFVRLAPPANDNRVPPSLLVLRAVVAIALLGLMASMIL